MSNLQYTKTPEVQNRNAVKGMPTLLSQSIRTKNSDTSEQNRKTWLNDVQWL